MRPATVAMIGASVDLDKFSGKVARSLAIARDGAGTRVTFVNRRGGDIQGQAAHRSLDVSPSKVSDHVYVCVPEASLLDTLEAAMVFGNRVLTVMTDVGPEVSQQIRGLAEAYDAVVYGPNCNGVIVPRTGYAATSSSVALERHPSGPIAIVSNSGGVGQALGLLAASRLGIGVSAQVSVGNAVATSEADVLNGSLKDPGLRVVVLLLEKYTDPKRLVQEVEAARRAGRHVLVMKLGSTNEGRQAAIGHSGVAGSDDRLVAAALTAVGATFFSSIEDMLLAAHLLCQPKQISAPSATTVSISGGTLVYVADRFAEHGIAHPEFSDELQEELAHGLPSLARLTNPVDISAGADRDGAEPREADPTLSHALQALSGQRDGFVCVALTFPPASQLEAVIRQAPALGVPLVVSWHGHGRPGSRTAAELRLRGIPVFPTPEAAAVVIGRLQGSTQQPRPAAQNGYAGTYWSDREQLATWQLPLPPARLATSLPQAEAAAAELGLPVVLKTGAKGVIHKAKAGGVLLDCATEGEVSTGYRRMVRTITAAGFEDAEHVVVEAMVAPRRPSLLVITRDDDLGFVALLQDGVVGAEADALVAVCFSHEPCSVTMLDDRRADEDILPIIEHLFAALHADRRIGSVEINPLVATDAGHLALDALISWTR